MPVELTDEILGAYVDEELDPALMSLIEIAAQRSYETTCRLRAIRRVTVAVRALCQAYDVPVSNRGELR